MEEGDPHALALWKRFRDLSIVKYKEIYKRLNVHFDVFSGESQYSMKQMTDVVNELEAKGLLEDDEKARIIRLDEYGAGTAVIQKKDGSMLYLSRDLAAAKDRYDTYDFDAQFYVVGLPQSHHFKQLFKIFELCGYQFRDRCVHMAFGSVEGMSSRKGNVVFLEQILDITKEEMHNVMRKNESKYAQIEDPDMVSDLVGMSSIIIQDFSGRSIKDYMFEWSRMLSFEGDTGPYLQYAHARLCSIERGVSFEIELDQIKMEILAEPRCEKLLDLLAMYPDIVREAGIYREPILVVKYVLRVAHAVSSALKDIYVLNQPQEIALTRLAMYKCARIVLGNALSILGLRPLLRM
jgi:arginyl-tRNA synthetase